MGLWVFLMKSILTDKKKIYKIILIVYIWIKLYELSILWIFLKSLITLLWVWINTCYIFANTPIWDSSEQEEEGIGWRKREGQCHTSDFSTVFFLGYPFERPFNVWVGLILFIKMFDQMKKTKCSTKWKRKKNRCNVYVKALMCTTLICGSIVLIFILKSTMI